MNVLATIYYSIYETLWNWARDRQIFGAPTPTFPKPSSMRTSEGLGLGAGKYCSLLTTFYKKKIIFQYRMSNTERSEHE